MKKKILGLVAFVLVLALSIPAAISAQVVYEVTIDPMYDGNLVGEDHTITVTVDPAVAADVSLDIEEGPNAGVYLTGVTDGTTGQYSFTYTSNGECGRDSIWVSVGDPILEGHRVFKYWLIDKFSGGGKIVQEDGPKKKDWAKITWGGWAGHTCDDNNFGPEIVNGNGYESVGEFEVTFHNVAGTQLDKHKFKTDQVLRIWYFDFSEEGCPGAAPPPSEANFAQVSILGRIYNPDGSPEPGFYILWINGMDNGEPGNSRALNGDLTTDGIRFILWPLIGPRVYDSYLSGDFLADQAFTCSDNGVRHELDAGNLQIVAEETFPD